MTVLAEPDVERRGWGRGHVGGRDLRQSQSKEHHATEQEANADDGAGKSDQDDRVKRVTEQEVGGQNFAEGFPSFESQPLGDVIG